MQSNRLRKIEELSIIPADPASPIPLYHQIEMGLRELIRSGVLRPDDVLPTEMELSRAYDVGRHTIRMALSRLVEDDLIARQAGRGTFIKRQADRMKFYLDRSFTRQMQEMGLRPHSDVITTSTGVVNAASPPVLRSKIGANCFNMVRLRYGNTTPVGLQFTTILTAQCPGIEAHDFSTESLYDVLSNDYNLEITRITHTVSAAIADSNQADMLRITVGSALLVVNTAAYLVDHSVIEYTTSYYRADMYEFSTTHTYVPRRKG
jgi:GntR family transcriptional regulator